MAKWKETPTVKTTHTLAEVRTTISSLLSASEREFKLEFNAIGAQTKDFDDSRKLGVVIFTLATICFQNPEALKRLEKRVADINRQVHILDARRTVDESKRRKIT